MGSYGASLIHSFGGRPGKRGSRGDRRAVHRGGKHKYFDVMGNRFKNKRRAARSNKSVRYYGL